MRQAATRGLGTALAGLLLLGASGRALAGPPGVGEEDHEKKGRPGTGKMGDFHVSQFFWGASRPVDRPARRAQNGTTVRGVLRWMEPARS